HTPTPADKLLAAELTGMLLEIIVGCRVERTLAGKVLAVVRGIRALGVEVVRHSLEAQDQVYRGRGAQVECPKCGLSATKLKLKERERMTLLGKVPYRR